MSRFSHRPKRLKRQRESYVFRNYLMPLGWFVGALGGVGMGAAVLAHLVEGRWLDEVFRASVALGTVPFLLLGLRFVRGHFDKRLKEA